MNSSGEKLKDRCDNRLHHGRGHGLPRDEWSPLPRGPSIHASINDIRKIAQKQTILLIGCVSVRETWGGGIENEYFIYIIYGIRSGFLIFGRASSRNSVLATHLVDEVLDGPGEDEVDLVHVPAEAVGHLPHLVRPDEVDRRVDHPAARRRRKNA